MDFTWTGEQREASLRKRCLRESFVGSSGESILTYGARGFVQKYDVGGDLMDAVGSLISGGTTDNQRVVIARTPG